MTRVDAYGRDLALVRRAQREAAALAPAELRELVERLTREAAQDGLVGEPAIRLEAARDELRKRELA
jgi:hypothetical protein